MKGLFQKSISTKTKAMLFNGFEIKREIVICINVLLIAFMTSCKAKESTITFQLDTNSLTNVNSVSVIGNVSPFSENKALNLEDKDGDGIYEITITFKTSKRYTKFKFLVNGLDELQGSNYRRVWFKTEPITKEYVFNEFNYYSIEELDSLIYTNTQIEEDVKVLKRIIQYVHPAIYKFRDSLSLQNDFKILEADLKSMPTLNHAYGAISKFVAKIKCSHTFTNPWNQGSQMERANYHVPDKIPFTFNRLGKRLFIDKNASQNKKLTKGLEIISINNVTTNDVLTKLSNYVTSDGDNYKKKLDRLLVTGEEKFALFDVFYPIEFGRKNTFLLALRDVITNQTFEMTVNATSKTNRTKLMKERYGSLSLTLEDRWNFKVLDKNTAHLVIKSFAIHNNVFDWESFLDASFKELKAKSIPNLIIDIRGNEGGDGVVGEYIFERIIQKATKINAMQSSVRYLEIPEDFKKHISTWDRFPYDFKGKITSEINGRYLLKEKYSVPELILKPKKKGFKGQVYLMTDASNSSATHLFAMYAKGIENITIVGQETGGNQMGTNGSNIFFMRLPNTKIEVDIPVVNQFIPLKEGNSDGGVKPDLEIKKNINDFINKKDTELLAVLKLIETKN